MAYNEKIAESIRQALAGTKKLVEKKMFGGVAFMVNDKMCVGVDNDDLIVRCIPEMTNELLAKKGARPFDLTGKQMNGWLLVSPAATKSKRVFNWWIQLAIESNKKVTGSKKKNK